MSQTTHVQNAYFFETIWKELSVTTSDIDVYVVDI